MDTLQYLNFIIQNAFLIFALLFMVMGFLIGLKLKSMRMKSQRHTYVVFVDTGEIFDHWGWGEVFSLDDADYVIDHHKTKGGTLFFDSRFAEPPHFESMNFNVNGIPSVQFEPDFKNPKWRYWIDSKMFFRVYENKVLEKMMQIQASDRIMYILVCCVIIIFISLVSVYLGYTNSTALKQLVLMASDLVKALHVG